MAQAGPSPPRNFITESRIGPPALRSWPGDRVALVNVEPWLVTPGPPARAGRSHGPPASPSVTVTVTSPYGHCQRPWYGRVTGPSATEPLMIADVTLCNARAALAAATECGIPSSIGHQGFYLKRCAAARRSRGSKSESQTLPVRELRQRA